MGLRSMISIIMAVKDNKYYTEKCIESIKLNTDCEYELILIDNASGTETAEYLKTLSCKVIRNETNKGCAGAWNQGIMASSGKYICIINNDILVPKLWASFLKNFFENNKYKLISPCMREGELNYDLEKYNDWFAKLFNGKIFVDEFRGVCLFAAKSLFDELGYFDENFKIGKFEDEDLFLRIKQKKGYTALTTQVVVHHYGSKTIQNIKKESPQNSFEQNNREYFHKKWDGWYLWRRFYKFRIQLRRKFVKMFYRVEY